MPVFVLDECFQLQTSFVCARIFLKGLRKALIIHHAHYQELNKNFKGELLTKLELTFYLQRSISNLHLKILFIRHYKILLIPK